MNSYEDKTAGRKPQWISSAHHNPTAKGKGTFQFADRRQAASIQRKTQSVIQNSPIVKKTGVIQHKVNKSTPVVQRSMPHNGVIQLMDKKKLEAMFQDIKNNNKKGFKQKFRGIAPGMDEEISCEVTFNKARALLKTKGRVAVKIFLTKSHKLRLPTKMTAHYVKGRDGKIHRMVHPTKHNTLMYGAEYNKKGNPRWTGHTSWDRARAKHVKGGNDEQEMQDRAIEYTLGSGAQPPFAKNSLKKYPKYSRRARKAHKMRERLKRYHSAYNSKSRQKYNKKWYPDPDKRGVSPVRELPSD